jgi:hypothetical protein
VRDFRGWAHSGQNLAVGDTWLPQLGQAGASGAAHSSQNFAVAGFSCWHLRHSIAYPRGERWEAKVSQSLAVDAIRSKEHVCLACPRPSNSMTAMGRAAMKSRQSAD